jgi:hypothetical protein
MPVAQERLPAVQKQEDIIIPEMSDLTLSQVVFPVNDSPIAEEEFALELEPFVPSAEPISPAAEPFVPADEPFVPADELFVLAAVPSVPAAEPFVPAEEPFVLESVPAIEEFVPFEEPLESSVAVQIDLRTSDPNLGDIIKVEVPENFLVLEPVPAVPGLPVGRREPSPVGAENPRLFNLTPVPAVPGLPVLV